MAKFRVLRGHHNEGGKTYDVGDIVDSKSNLLQHNFGRSIRFEAVLDPNPVNEDGLDQLTVTQLRALAAEEEVGLVSATLKDDIIEVLRGKGVRA